VELPELISLTVIFILNSPPIYQAVGLGFNGRGRGKGHSGSGIGRVEEREG